MPAGIDESVVIRVGDGNRSKPDLSASADALGLVVFAHGSGSSRFSSRNRTVAKSLQQRRLGTLLLDLLTKQEDSIDARTAEYRFDIDRLGRRVVLAIDWIGNRDDIAGLPIGCFGASTGSAAAPIAAAERPSTARAPSSLEEAGPIRRRSSMRLIAFMSGASRPRNTPTRASHALMRRRPTARRERSTGQHARGYGRCRVVQDRQNRTRSTAPATRRALRTIAR